MNVLELIQVYMYIKLGTFLAWFILVLRRLIPTCPVQLHWQQHIYPELRESDMQNMANRIIPYVPLTIKAYPKQTPRNGAHFFAMRPWLKHK